MKKTAAQLSCYDKIYLYPNLYFISSMDMNNGSVKLTLFTNSDVNRADCERVGAELNCTLFFSNPYQGYTQLNLTCDMNHKFLTVSNSKAKNLA